MQKNIHVVDIKIIALTWMLFIRSTILRTYLIMMKFI